MVKMYFTIDKFCEQVDCGFFVPSDGFGYYAFDKSERKEAVTVLNSATIRDEANKKGYTYIIWDEI